MMKKILTIIALVVAAVTFAQPPGDKHADRAERIKAHKIAFISTSSASHQMRPKNFGRSTMRWRLK